MDNEHFESFRIVLETAKKERDFESSMKEEFDKKRKMQRHDHFLNRMVFGIPGDPEFLFEL